MSNDSLNSHIIWNEVHTTDLDKTIAFYGSLFGWTTRPEERETYIHFYQGEKSVGGVFPIQPGVPIPPHWALYVGCDDVEAYIKRAEDAGGKALMPMMDLPEVGKFCAVADAEGAVLSPFAPTNTDRDSWERTGAPGTFCWVELMTRDVPAARAFYDKVVGWEMHDMEMGMDQPYTILTPKGAENGTGGIMPMAPEQPGPACWLAYVAVEDIDASTDKAVELGATIVVPATDIPDVGRFSIITDPCGATFAMYWSKPEKCS